MTDYSKLPREELIKEIECWRDRCSDQQLVYVDDLKVYVDQELDKVKEYYDNSAKQCIERAKEYTDKMCPEKRDFYGHDLSDHKNELARREIVTQYPPQPPNLKSLILKFLENKK